MNEIYIPRMLTRQSSACISIKQKQNTYVKGYDVEVDNLDGVVDLNMDVVEEGQSFFRSFNKELIPGLKKLLLFSKSFSYISSDI